jgi:hypothetical protein
MTRKGMLVLCAIGCFVAVQIVMMFDWVAVMPMVYVLLAVAAICIIWYLAIWYRGVKEERK